MSELLGTSINFVISAIMFLFLGAALLRRMKIIALSPTYALIGFYLVMFVVGPFAYDPAFTGGGMVFDVSFENEITLLPRILWMLCATMAGVLLFAALSPRQKALAQDAQSFKPIHLSKAQCVSILCLMTLALTVETIAVGPANLWYRHVYLISTSRLVKSLGDPLMIGSVPLAGLIVGQINPALKRYKSIARVYFAVMLLVYASESTRTLALALPFYSVGRYAADPANRRSVKRLLAAVVLVPVVMIYPLTARSGSNQGIIAIPQNVMRCFASDGESTGTDAIVSGVHRLLNNVFISVPTTDATTTFSVGNNLHYFLTSVNPAPSFMTDLANLPVLLDPVTPLNAIGDLLRTGMVYSLIYFALLGVFLGSLETNIRSGRGASLIRIAQIGVMFMFIAISLQYPLRNATRLVYYAIFIEVGLMAVEFFQLKPIVPTTSAVSNVRRAMPGSTRISQHRQGRRQF